MASTRELGKRFPMCKHPPRIIWQEGALKETQGMTCDGRKSSIPTIATPQDLPIDWEYPQSARGRPYPKGINCGNPPGS